MKYIAHINNTSGKIITISFPTSNNPAEGVTDEIRVLYITESNLPTGCDDLLFFIQQHWYDVNTGAFINIGMPPNDYATWDLTSYSWTWDSSEILREIRQKRNGMLYGTDWSQVPDNTLTEAQREEARTYRTALRDVTNGLTVPDNIDNMTWPTKPSFL